MHRVLATFSCLLLTLAAADAGEPRLPDDIPLSDVGGVIILHRGDTTTVTLGGGLFRRRVCIRTACPDGPIITRFTMPPSSHFPVAPPFPVGSSALITIAIPDTDGVVLLDDQVVSTDGTLRYLQSPPLPPDKAYPVRLSSAYRVGDRIVVEEQQITLHAGDQVSVKFEGKNLIGSVPVPQEPEQAPPPRKLPK